MTTLYRIGAIIVASTVLVATWNYFSVTQPAMQRLAKDSRNEKVGLYAYHRYGVMPSSIVVDLRRVGDDVTTMDVVRALLQTAEAHKDKEFNQIVLAYKGEGRFLLDGTYYRKLGREYETQNPMYTLRTLPENVHKLDGSAAYGTWTGGWLGVLSKQMEDLNQFAKDWFIADLAQDSAGQ